MHELLRRRSPPLDIPFTVNRNSPQARGLVSWWPMIAHPGVNILHDLAGENLGSFPGGANNPAWNKDADRAIGLTFDGGDYISIGTSRLPTSGPWTIWAWVRPTAAAGSDLIFLFGAENNFEGPHISSFNGTWRCAIWGDGVADGNSVVTGVLKLICGTYDGTNLRLYEDGVLTAGPTAGTYNTPASLNARMGNRLTATTSGWVGDIYEVAVHNVALSATEIAHIVANPWDLYRPNERLWPAVVATNVSFPWLSPKRHPSRNLLLRL